MDDGIRPEETGFEPATRELPGAPVFQGPAAGFVEDNPGTEQDSEPDPDNGMIVPRADQNPVENRRIQLILNAQSELENFEEQVGEFERNQIIQDLNIEDWLTPSTELYIDDVG